MPGGKRDVAATGEVPAMLTTRPGPGTVAAYNPPPGPVEEAMRLLGEDVEVADAAERLAARNTAEDLRSAQLWWVRRLPRAGWNDYRAGAILRVLERALAKVDGLGPGSNVAR